MNFAEYLITKGFTGIKPQNFLAEPKEVTHNRPYDPNWNYFGVSTFQPVNGLKKGSKECIISIRNHHTKTVELYTGDICNWKSTEQVPTIEIIDNWLETK